MALVRLEVSRAGIGQRGRSASGAWSLQLLEPALRRGSFAVASGGGMKVR